MECVCVCHTSVCADNPVAVLHRGQYGVIKVSRRDAVAYIRCCGHVHTHLHNKAICLVIDCTPCYIFIMLSKDGNYKQLEYTWS